MEITDIKIRRTYDDTPLKAVASVTYDNALALHDIKIIYAGDRYFLVMPGRKKPDGTFRDIVHPINRETRNDLEKKVLDKFLEQ